MLLQLTSPSDKHRNLRFIWQWSSDGTLDKLCTINLAQLLLALFGAISKEPHRHWTEWMMRSSFGKCGWMLSLILSFIYSLIFHTFPVPWTNAKRVSCCRSNSSNQPFRVFFILHDGCSSKLCGTKTGWMRKDICSYRGCVLTVHTYRLRSGQVVQFLLLNSALVLCR